MATKSKMFVHYKGTVAAFKAAGLEEQYKNHIVFIKGGEADGKGEAVYTHGQYYGDVKAALAALQAKVDGMKYFSKISDGNTTAQTAGVDGVITIKGDDPTITTLIDTTGIKIALSDEFKTKVNTTLPNAVSALEGKLGNKDASAAAGADATAFGRIKNLETIVAGLTGAEGGEVESVDAKVTKAINALDVDAKAGDFVASVKQVDGKIEATMGTFNFDEAGAAATAKSEVIGASGDASTANTIYGAKKYAEEKANAAKSGAEATASADATAKANQALADAKAYVGEEIAKLDADVTSAETGKVKVQVVEVDGKVTEVHVTESDIASAATLAEVKADVDAFFKDALGDTDAQQVKDTLKEIQEYINSDAEAASAMTASIKEAKDAADAAQAAADKAQGEVDALEGVVAGVKATADAAATQVALDAEILRADTAEKANAAAIKAIADDYLKDADKTELAGLISAEAGTARAAEKANADAIKAISDDYLKTADKTELQSNIDAKVAQADYDVKIAALEAKDAELEGFWAWEEL